MFHPELFLMPIRRKTNLDETNPDSFEEVTPLTNKFPTCTLNVWWTMDLRFHQYTVKLFLCTSLIVKDNC